VNCQSLIYFKCLYYSLFCYHPVILLFIILPAPLHCCPFIIQSSFIYKGPISLLIRVFSGKKGVVKNQIPVSLSLPGALGSRFFLAKYPPVLLESLCINVQKRILQQCLSLVLIFHQFFRLTFL